MEPAKAETPNPEAVKKTRAVHMYRLTKRVVWWTWNKIIPDIFWRVCGWERVFGGRAGLGRFLAELTAFGPTLLQGLGGKDYEQGYDSGFGRGWQTTRGQTNLPRFNA